MKKLFILPVLAFLLVATIVSAATLTRNAPTQVTPGQVFTVTYTPSGTPTGNWFVAWEDTATGGCQPAKYQAFLANGGTGSTTFTAPQSGSCTLTGFYQFTEDSKKNFVSTTITVGTTGCPTGQSKCSDGTCKTTCPPIGQCEDTINQCGGACPPCEETNWTLYIAIGVGLLLVLLMFKRK